MRPDCLEVPAALRTLGASDATAAAVWNTWQFVVQRRFENELRQWRLELPKVPIQAQPGPLSEEARRVVLFCIDQMMRIQAQTVLGYHHGSITNWRPALGLCKSIADDAPAVIERIESGDLP